MPPIYTLDPSLPIDEHLVWDGWVEGTGARVAWPNIYIEASGQYSEARGLRCLLDDDQLAIWTEAMREVVKQPLVGQYAAAADSLHVFLEEVVKHRLKKRGGRDGRRNRPLTGGGL